MIEISKIKVGDKVHYTPFKDCARSQIENGMVKEILDRTDESIRVVYYCNNEWDRFMDYTSALTDVDRLDYGWK